MRSKRTVIPIASTGGGKDIEPGFSYSDLEKLWNEVDEKIKPLEMIRPGDITKQMVSDRYGICLVAAHKRMIGLAKNESGWKHIRVRGTNGQSTWVLRKINPTQDESD
jgi:hypothetical protein